MRIAALILTLILGAVVTVQSCAIYALGNVAQAKESIGGGALGLAVAIAWLVGAAFVIGAPTVALIAYLVGGLFALMAASTGFSDMGIWAIASLVLAALAFLGRREKRKKAAAIPPTAQPTA